MRWLLLLAVTGTSLAAAASSNPSLLFDGASGRAVRQELPRIVPRAAPLQKKHASPYLNANTSKFAVDGTSLPDIDFDIGESYAGLLPISAAKNESRQLFFWFFPSQNPAASNEVTIWLNGGPGCSSLTGAAQENGVFSWIEGTFAPVPNPYSWTNLTNMLYIEQPIGVGFTQGVADIVDEIGLAEQFMGFYRNFFDAFGLRGRQTFITGESYGGVYVSYIADAMLKAKDPTYFNVSGIMLIDPIIGDSNLHYNIPEVPFLNFWEPVFALNSSFVADVRTRADTVCNYTDYFNTYLQFPPPGPFPPAPGPFDAVDPTPQNLVCDLYDDIFNAALLVNPCFNAYHVADQCPLLWNVQGDISHGYNPAGASVYFNRSDVQRALHVPPTDWQQCVSNQESVFQGPDGNNPGDLSPPPALSGALQRVIEGTNNAIITGGLQDFVLLANGTLLVIQNMTWNGVQGFTSPPTSEFYIPYHPDPFLGALAGAGIAGNFATERGLTFVTVTSGGHQLPQYSPGGTYRMLEFLLGRISGLGEVSDFTTQTGNFTGVSGPFNIFGIPPERARARRP